jgi:hypothetical protein
MVMAIPQPVMAQASVRDDLAREVERIGAHATRMTRGQLAGELASIRRTASANGIQPAITVIHAIDAALSRGERGPLVHGWLNVLRDAVACPTSDVRTCETFAAICSVRLDG